MEHKQEDVCAKWQSHGAHVLLAVAMLNKYCTCSEKGCLAAFAFHRVSRLNEYSSSHLTHPCVLNNHCQNGVRTRC
eukprot:6466393-Amphidinium_carterae.3